jgi:hypothetical protein
MPLSRSTWLVAFLATVPLASGCTFEDGTGFATLESASLELRLEPGAARDLGNQTILSDRAYAVRLETARVGVGTLELRERTASGGSQGGRFDPANPPPGYSLCHGGHCHSDDGRLVAYEEIEAELAGAGSTLVSIARLPVHDTLDLWGTEPTRLSRVQPSRELPRAHVSRLAIGIESLELSGQVGGGPADGGIAAPVPFEVNLPIQSGFDKLFELVIDRDRPGAFSLQIRVITSGRLVDGIDYAALVSDGRIELDDPESPAALTLVQSLLASEMTVAVK